MGLSLRARLWRYLIQRAFRNKPKTLAEVRAQSQSNARMMILPRDVTVEDAPIDEMHGLWIRPNSGEAHQVILYLHGGGYVTGDSHSYRTLCAPLARLLKIPILIPDYRLAPEHPFPAGLEDAQKTYRWLLAQGFAAHNIVLCGDSAGGGLSMATVIALRNAGLPLPAAVVCLSPWADLTLSGQSHTTQADAEVMLSTDMLREWAAYYTHAANWTHPLVSPIFADLTDFPPLLIQVGSREILLDDARRLAENARAAGVDVTLSVYDGLWHVWPILGDLIPESKAAFEEIGAFLNKKT
ncbi:MAG: alpha/beta hydrolase [Anaerolineales bacterium]